MKKAVLLHGTDGSTQDQWFPWLNRELELAGYSVFSPELPESHTPSRIKYEDFLKSSGWDFKDNILIGHSSGATTILNLCMTDWLPKLKAVVMIGSFLNQDLVKKAQWYEKGQFDDLFRDNYNIKKIKKKSDNFIFVHGSDDPYCSIDDARNLCDKLNGEFITIKRGHHLGGDSGIFEIPQIIDELNRKNLL